MSVMDEAGKGLTIWDNPKISDIPSQLPDFMEKLGGPAIIRQDGLDRQRVRVVVTLLHGNEPSGAIAVHQLLLSGAKPRVDMVYLIVCVNTALTEPLFTHRFLPGLRDMNRCFREPFEGQQGLFACSILEYLGSLKAEAIIDIHNTSGNGPAFSVCTHQLERCYDIASLFTHRLIFNHIHLGALMEVTDFGCPIVTIECGGSHDPRSHQIALEGLEKYVAVDELYHQMNHDEIDLYYHPVRLELAEGGTLTYADNPVPGIDITLPTHIDRRNFGVVLPDMPLAWVKEYAFDSLRVRDEQGRNVIEDYFTVEGGRLYVIEPLKLFMVTTDPLIARSDCILYAVKETDHQSLFT